MSSVDAVRTFARPDMVYAHAQCGGVGTHHPVKKDVDFCLALLSPDFDLTDTIEAFGGCRLILASNNAARDVPIVEKNGFVLCKKFCIVAFMDDVNLTSTVENDSPCSTDDDDDNDNNNLDECGCYQQVRLYIRD